MAFPGTYNISYYRGDSYEFNVYPKTSSGNAFSLTDYASAVFTIATARGSSSLLPTTFTATLEEDSLVVTLTSGDTASLRVGQKITGVTGTGEFADGVIIASITASDSFTVSSAHLTDGAVSFRIDQTYSGFAEISSDKTYVKCVITPEVGKYLDASKAYVYDVQIGDNVAAVDYDISYTLLTGNISVTEEVSV